MTFRLTVLSGVLSAIILGSGAAAVASVHSSAPLPPSGPTQSRAPWSITGNVTPITSPSDFHGGSPLPKTNFQLVKPYYYVVQGSKIGDNYQYPFLVKAKHGVSVISIELRTNDANHTALFEVGIPTKQTLKEASQTPSGGSSASSSGSANNG